MTALDSDDRLGDVRAWLLSGIPGTEHHGFPVVDSQDRLLGVLTRRDLEDSRRTDEVLIRELLSRASVVAFENSSLREAANLMVTEGVGRLPVVSPDDLTRVRGMLTRSDLLSAHAHRLDDEARIHPCMVIPTLGVKRRGSAA